MPYGLRIKNPAGAVSVEYSNNLGRWLRDVNTGTTDGSLYVPEWETSRGAFILLETLPVSAPVPAATGPNAWMVGATINWAWSANWNWTKTPSILRLWVY